MILNKRTQGLVLAVIANIIWGSTFISSSKLMAVMPTFSAIFLRIAIAAIVMIGIGLILKVKIEIPKNKTLILQITGNAIVSFVLIYAFQLQGLRSISSSLSAAIMFFSPLFVVIISSFLKMNFELKNFVGISTGILGGLILVYDKGYNIGLAQDLELQGIVYTFVASFFLSVSTFTTKKVSQKMDVFNTTFWSMVFSLPILFISSYFENDGLISLSISSEAWSHIFYLSVICSAFAFYIWNYAISITEPSYVASTMHIKTPVAIILGVVVGSEVFQLNYLLGIVIVSFGIFLTKANFRYPLWVAKIMAFKFSPDLIVEATKLCNKKCEGCYASNIIIKNNITDFSNYELSVDKLDNAVGKLSALEIKQVSIRGGEPTLNSNLYKILISLSKRFQTVFLETNGDWLLSNSKHTDLLEVCARNKIIVKISFDSMHGSKYENLVKMLDVLEAYSIDYKIAITEKNKNILTKVINELEVIPFQKIIIQKFADNSKDLLKPKQGVVTFKGEIKSELSTVF